MKNINLILISIAIASLTSCGNKNVKIDVVPKTPMTIEIGASVEAKEKPELSNPNFMYGSSFGEFFISTIRTQNFDMALRFTSKESVDKFGIEKIREFYSTYDFNYSLKLKSSIQRGNIYTLKYATNEFATGKLKTMTIVIENDSCKIILDKSLNIFQ